MFEELSRVFMLNRLWIAWPQPGARWGVLIASAVLFGLVHAYQGPANAIVITVQGMLYALYDSIQIIQVFFAFHHG
jgi:membrane protease YdiL (CAAX protease family)